MSTIFPESSGAQNVKEKRCSIIEEHIVLFSSFCILQTYFRSRRSFYNSGVPAVGLHRPLVLLKTSPVAGPRRPGETKNGSYAVRPGTRNSISRTSLSSPDRIIALDTKCSLSCFAKTFRLHSNREWVRRVRIPLESAPRRCVRV